MRASGFALLGLMGCLPDLKETSDANGPEIGETCTTVGVANVESGEEVDTRELLEAYEAPFATRIALTLEEGSYYTSGEVESLDGEKSNLTCMGSEAGGCEVDLYNNCADTETGWFVDFNTAPAGVACQYLGKEGEPDCEIEGTQLSITVEE